MAPPIESWFKQTTQPEGDSTKISVFDQMDFEEILKDFPLCISHWKIQPP